MSQSPDKNTIIAGEASFTPSEKDVHTLDEGDGNRTGGENKTRSGDNNIDIEEKDFGSGLAAFFKDFVPYQSDTNGKPIEFSTGLDSMPTPTNPIEYANHIEASIGIKYIDGGLRYSQWRNNEKEYLTEYLMKRLYPHSDDEVIENTGSTLSSSESSDGDDDEEEVEPHSQSMMETQEPVVVEKNQSLEEKKSSRKEKKRKRKNSIPYVGDCLHDLTKLEFLDLHARTLSLNLSRIDKVWKLRDTKRSGALTKRSIRKPVFERCSPTSRSRRPQQLSKRLIFEEKEDDGPVSAIYKKVIHFEVEQLHVAQAGPGLSPNFMRQNGGKQFQQRIKVFFYNSYATAISEWIKEQQRLSSKKRIQRNSPTNGLTDISTATTDIVMSLSNIPAACIFPYSADPRNWREKHDLVDYCLCIGDKSVAKARKNLQEEANSNENQIRFDSKEMEIRLMAVKTKTTTSTTDAHSFVTTNVVNDVDVSSELILSRSRLTKDFLSSSSSEEKTPEMLERKENQNISDDSSNPLQKSWEKYERTMTENKIERGNKENIGSNERLHSRQLNQRQHNHSHVLSTTCEQQTNIPRSDNAILVPTEPMIFEGAPQRRSDSKQIIYESLGDIASLVDRNVSAGKGCNIKVNLYASVVAVTPPRITKRGDFMIAATLIDESCLTPMTINIFCKKQDDLPKLIWMGDVIRIHRAVLKKWYDKIQLQGLIPTQYVVIRKFDRRWHVIPTAKNSFTFNKSDEERSQTLWRWANRNAEKNPSMKPEHCFTLQELQHLKKDEDETTFESRDITVMVVQKLRFEPSSVLPQGLLRVWDGTGNSPSDPLFMSAKLLQSPPQEERSTAYPRAIEKVISTAQKLQASIETMEIPISLCGRVSNVVVWEKSHWALIHKHIPVGTFLRLRNVHIPLKWESNNFRSIFMHDKSWMTALPSNNFEVRSLICQHNQRIRNGNNDTYNPEFGGGFATLPHLPTCKFVGTGLSHLRHEDKAKVYTGAVYILQDKDDSSRASNDAADDVLNVVIVADRSGSLRVHTIPKIRQELQNLLSDDIASAIGRRFLVTVRMIALHEDGPKHFVLTNIARID